MGVLRDIRFESHCEHHIAPIIGRAHIAYLPQNRVVGISKLARVLDVYSKRLQIQEKLTAQIANTINEVLQPKRSEEHTSELQSLMRISYAVFCLKKKTPTPIPPNIN